MSEQDDRDWYADYFLTRHDGDIDAAFKQACSVVAHHEDTIARLHIEGHAARRNVSAGYVRDGFTPIRPPKRPVAAIDIPPVEAQHD